MSWLNNTKTIFKRVAEGEDLEILQSQSYTGSQKIVLLAKKIVNIHDQETAAVHRYFRMSVLPSTDIFRSSVPRVDSESMACCDV